MNVLLFLNGTTVSAPAAIFTPASFSGPARANQTWSLPLGTIFNSAASTIVPLQISYYLTIQDLPYVVQGSIVTQTVTLSWSTSSSQTISLPQFSVIEPVLSVNLAAGPIVRQAGDSVQFNLTVMHAPISTIGAYSFIYTQDVSILISLLLSTINNMTRWEPN